MVSNLSWDYYCTPSPTICPSSLLPHLLSVCSKPYCFHSNLLSLLALYSWQKKGGYQVTLLSASCYQSCELACICSHFSFCFCARNVPISESNCGLNFYCGSYALLPSQGLPWLFLLFSLSLTSLFSLSPSFLLSTFKCCSILKTSEILWPPFSFSSQPRLYRIICSPPPFVCILCSSISLHFLQASPTYCYKLLIQP